MSGSPPGMVQGEEGPPPTVDIGLPVYNGERTVGRAIDAVLAQSFTDFRLLVSDNASTDRTRSVCAARASADARVSYVRQERNLGAVANFDFVLRQARAPYFLWVAADDRLHPDFLAENLRVLHEHPEAVASVSRVRMGTRHDPSSPRVGTAPLRGDYVRRLGAYLAEPALNSRFYGVYRCEAIQRAYVPRAFLASDWAVIVNVLREGEFHEVERVLLERAVDGESSRAVSEQVGGLSPLRPRSWVPLGDFTAWLWRNLPTPVFLRCLPEIVRLNVSKTTKMLYELTPVAAARAAQRRRPLEGR